MQIDSCWVDQNKTHTLKSSNVIKMELAKHQTCCIALWSAEEFRYVKTAILLGESWRELAHGAGLGAAGTRVRQPCLPLPQQEGC